MNPLRAYNQHKQPASTRIEVILAVYRKAMERLDRAEARLASGQAGSARTLLLEAQTFVASLATGLAGSKDETAISFLRLYEFVCHKIGEGTLESVQAALKVLSPLREAFEAVREHAIALEAHGIIPPLDRPQQLQMTA